MPPESRAAEVREFENGSPANVSTRVWQFRFSLRTLLLAPVLVGAILLCVFPKLVTGDYAEVTVTNIRVSEGNLRVELAATVSADTGIGVNLADSDVFDSLGIKVRWKRWIPTWPKHGPIVISVGLRDDYARTADGKLESLLGVKIGETYRVTPVAPLKLPATQDGFGRRGQGSLQVMRGSRLGIKL